jgi:hypothetical protein
MRSVFVFLSIVFALFAQAAEIAPGTHILLRLEQNVSAKNSKPGAHIFFRTASVVAAGGSIVIPLGSQAEAIINNSRGPRLGRKHAELGMSLVSIMLPSGQFLKVGGPVSSVEPDDRGASVGHDSHGAALLFPATAAGALFGGRTGAGAGLAAGIAASILAPLLARGNDIVLRQGSAVDAVFESSVVIGE